MTPISLKHSAILLITALILVQGAAALTIEQAPLNPEFVAYMEGLDADNIDQHSIECYGDSCPATGTDTMPYATGDIPAPIVMVWPDTDTIDVYRATEAGGEVFPTRFDLRDEGRVTPVRDQGWCGSCWAFATIGSLESTYLTDTGTAENFSENNMKNLCSNLYPDGFDYGPCDGGNAQMSAAYLTRGNGPVQETDDPYLLPMPSTISSINLTPVLDVDEITFLPPRTGPLDNSLYKQTLMDEGAIQIWFQINISCFTDNDTTYYLPDGDYPIACNHIVTLVGWDDAFPKEDFAVTPPGDGAFILKNSWGTGLGDDGYFYISYYDVSLDYAVLFTGVPADEEKRIYQYDPLGATMEIGTGTDTTAYAANVFTADNYEELTDVSFYTPEPGTDYTVAIFANFTTPPGDAAPVAWASGTSALPGYHTISLPKTVPLVPGEEFSVVMKVTTPTFNYPITIETPIDGYSSKATAGLGESYVSEDGETWVDLTTIYPDTNACIKAFTHPLTVVPRDYTTIQEAVDAAVSGDTIVVEAGTYPEKLTLNKPITLLGVGTPVVTTSEHGIGAEIYADSVTVAGFSFEGSEGAFGGIGIRGNDCTLYDIGISGYKDGLHIGNVGGLSLSTIALHDNTNNLEFTELTDEPGNSIDETVTVNGRPVIYREGVSCEIIDESSDAGAVICVNCTDITIRDTTTKAIEDGIALHYCDGVTVENVTTDMATSGLLVYDSDNVSVRGSTFGPNLRNGIKTEEISGFLVEENEISCQERGSGIRLATAEDITITNNTISGGRNSVGVIGMLVINSRVTGNTITDGTDIGIGIGYGDELVVSGNTAESPVCGIYVNSVWNTLVSGNTIRCNDTGYGMVISGDGLEVTGNIAENCSIQATMELNDSVVSKNSFSGAEYPAIVVWPEGGDVFVYRNDFVLTDTEPTPGISSASATGTAVMPTKTMDLADIIRSTGLPDDEISLRELSMEAVACGMTDTAATALPPEAEMKSAAWHSPAEETYWYYGRAFTQTMGNYWSTYTGTDTTHDGIGNTPFMIRDNETDICPLMNPVARYFNENPLPATDEDASADMATTPALSAGDTATLRFTGSAVQTVTVTTTEDTGRILLTVDDAGAGPDGLEGPVYQYLSAQLSGMTDDEVKEATFSFRVSAAWLNAEKLLPADIALWRFHDNEWHELPTSLLREENGWAYYEATTPGFSSFAIAASDGQKVTVTTDAAVPGGETKTDTANISVTGPSGNETASEPQVTVAVPEEGTGTPTGTTPQESPLGLFAIIGGAAGAALLSRKR